MSQMRLVKLSNKSFVSGITLKFFTERKKDRQQNFWYAFMVYSKQKNAKHVLCSTMEYGMITFTTTYDSKIVILDVI